MNLLRFFTQKELTGDQKLAVYTLKKNLNGNRIHIFSLEMNRKVNLTRFYLKLVFNKKGTNVRRI